MLNRLLLSGLLLTSSFVGLSPVKAMEKGEEVTKKLHTELVRRNNCYKQISNFEVKNHSIHIGMIEIDLDTSISLTGLQIKQIFKKKEKRQHIISTDSKSYLAVSYGTQAVGDLRDQNLYGSTKQYGRYCFGAAPDKEVDEAHPYFFTFIPISPTTNNNIKEVTLVKGPKKNHPNKQTTFLTLSGKQIKQILQNITVLKTNRGIIETSEGNFYVTVPADCPPVSHGINDNEILRSEQDKYGQYEFGDQYDPLTMKTIRYRPYYNFRLTPVK